MCCAQSNISYPCFHSMLLRTTLNVIVLYSTMPTTTPSMLTLLRTSSNCTWLKVLRSVMTLTPVNISIINTDYGTKPCVKEIKNNNQLINDKLIKIPVELLFNGYFVSIGSNLQKRSTLLKMHQAMLFVTFLGTIKIAYTSQTPLPMKYVVLSLV